MSCFGKGRATLPCVMKLLSRLFLLSALATGCATPKGPTNIAESYAKALEENRLADAYTRTTGVPEGVDGFQERYKEEAARRERAAAVRTSMDAMEARAPTLIVERRESSWRAVYAPCPTSWSLTKLETVERFN
jgi:hypothetical protein